MLFHNSPLEGKLIKVQTLASQSLKRKVHTSVAQYINVIDVFIPKYIGIVIIYGDYDGLSLWKIVA